MIVKDTSSRDAVKLSRPSESPAEEPVAIMVMGMHRSGTSALIAVLNILAANIPGELMPPTEHNAKGYFERRR